MQKEILYNDQKQKSKLMIFYDPTNQGIGLTYTRRTNLMKLGELNKRNVTHKKMMGIFDITIPDGGAIFMEGGLINIFQRAQ